MEIPSPVQIRPYEVPKELKGLLRDRLLLEGDGGILSWIFSRVLLPGFVETTNDRLSEVTGFPAPLVNLAVDWAVAAGRKAVTPTDFHWVFARESQGIMDRFRAVAPKYGPTEGLCSPEFANLVRDAGYVFLETRDEIGGGKKSAERLVR